MARWQHAEHFDITTTIAMSYPSKRRGFLGNQNAFPAASILVFLELSDVHFTPNVLAHSFCWRSLGHHPATAPLRHYHYSNRSC